MGTCLHSPAADIPNARTAGHVYFGDVRVGTIAKRVGIPHDEDSRETAHKL
jgi:hypothetical protein